MTRVCPSINLSVHRGGQVQPAGGGVRSSWGGSGPAGEGGSGPAGGRVKSSQPGGGQVHLAGGGQVQPGGSGPAGGGGSAKIGQHREYLVHGGQYASCVHAGGLSCYLCRDFPHFQLCVKTMCRGRLLNVFSFAAAMSHELISQRGQTLMSTKMCVIFTHVYELTVMAYSHCTGMGLGQVQGM